MIPSTACLDSLQWFPAQGHGSTAVNETATHGQPSRPRFLMCNPQHFAVTYSINPWMDPKTWGDRGAVLHAMAVRQWTGLHHTLLSRGAIIEAIEPKPGLPDLVFTANAAVVLDRKAMPARFRHRERQCEEAIFAAGFHAMQAHGLIDEIVVMPDGVALEGAGDCIWDKRRRLFWMGYGFRSDAAACHVIEEQFGVNCLPLELADPRFYHLDTAFCPLPCGAVLYYPRAFTAAALDVIHQHVAPRLRIPLSPRDAARFAANAVCFDRVLVLSSCSAELRWAVERRGYTVAETLLNVFLQSGGSACCLTLRLDHQSRTGHASAMAVA
jgi:N-dimethylarginine dimethylaminohydrolase